MGRVPLSEFVGARCRLQQLSSQRITSGWVRALRNDRLVIQCDEDDSFFPAEKYLVHLQGPSADAYGIASGTRGPIDAAPLTVGSLAREPALIAYSYEFALLTPLQFRDAQQNARKIIETIQAKLSVAGKTVEVLITDASTEGMGILAWTELIEGDVIGIRIESAKLQASFDGEVRHCRPEPRLIGMYRVGLKFHNPDRLSLRSWRKLLDPL